MASEKTLRRITKVLKGDTNPSDEDLLIRFKDIDGQDELDQIKETVLKKKDSTSISEEVDTESTTEAPSEATSLESSDQTEVIEGPQGTEVIEEMETEEVSSPSPKGSDDSEPTPEGDDEKWKQSYKDITSKLKIDGITGIGLNADEFQITQEQATEGTLPPLEKLIPGFDELNSIKKASTKAKYILNYNKISKQLKDAAELDELRGAEKTIEKGDAVPTKTLEEDVSVDIEEETTEPVIKNPFAKDLEEAKELGYTLEIKKLQKKYDDFEAAEQRLVTQKPEDEGESLGDVESRTSIPFSTLTTKTQDSLLFNLANVYDEEYPLNNISEIVSVQKGSEKKTEGVIPGETSEIVLDPKRKAENITQEKRKKNLFKRQNKNISPTKQEDIEDFKNTQEAIKNLNFEIKDLKENNTETENLFKENKISKADKEEKIKLNNKRIKEKTLKVEEYKKKEKPFTIETQKFDVTVKLNNGKEVVLKDVSTQAQLPEVEILSTPPPAEPKPSKEEVEAARKEFDKAKRKIKSKEIINKVVSVTGVRGSDISGNFVRHINEVVDNMENANSVPEGLFFKNGKATTLGVHVIASDEEPMDRFLNDLLDEYGLTIEQSGGGDAITVSDQSGNEITIDLDVARTNEDLSLKAITGGGEGDLGISLVDTKEQMKYISDQAKKLEDFIQEHAITTTAVDPTAGRETLDVKELQAMAQTQKELIKEVYKLAEVDFANQIIDIKLTQDELYKIIDDPDSTVEELDTALDEFEKANDEYSKLQNDFKAKLLVLDELQDLTVAFETKKYKNIIDFGTPYGDLDYSLWSYSWDVFFNAAKDTVLGGLLSFLEIVRLPFGGMPKEDREALRKDFGLLTEGLEADITDDERITVNHNAGFWQKFGVTLLEMAGNFAGAIVLGGPAAITTIMTTLPASSATAVYEKTSERMDNDPAFDNVPESHKTFVKAGIATAIFLLEKIGLKLSVGQLNRIVLDIVNEYLSKAGSRGIKGLLSYIADIFSNPNKLTKYIEKAAIGGVGEGTTEAAQGLSQKALQELFNKMEGEDLFSDAETFTGEVAGGFKETSEEIALGFTMGMLLGPLAPGADPTLTDTQIAQAALFEDPTTYKNFKTNLVVLLQKKKLTLEQVKNAIKNVDKIKNIFSKYKDAPGLTSKERFELTRKDFELQKVKDQQSKAGPLAKILFKKQIKQIESEIESIINKAEQRQSTETISDKKTRLTEKIKAQPKIKNAVSRGEKVEVYTNTRATSLDFNKLNDQDFSGEGKPDLIFLTPSDKAFSDYGPNKFKVSVQPKKPYYQSRNKVLTKKEIQDLKDQGYDAIITHPFYRPNKPIKGQDYNTPEEYIKVQNMNDNIEGQDNRNDLDIEEAMEIIPLTSDIVSDVELKQSTEETVSVPEQTVNIPEAENIVQKAIDEGRNLTLEDLSKVAETLPDLDIDISTDRDISPEELLTKIKEYAVQKPQPIPSDDAVGKPQDTESSEAVEEEVRGPEETKVEDEKQVDTKKPVTAVEDKRKPQQPKKPKDTDETTPIQEAGYTQMIKSIAQKVNNWFMDRDKAGNPNPKNFVEFFNKASRVIASAKRYLPQAFRNIVESENNYKAYFAKRGADLIIDFKAAILKIRDKKKRNEAKTASELYLNGMVPKEFFEGSKTKEEVLEDIKNEKTNIDKSINELEESKKGKSEKEVDIINSRIANLEARLEKIENFENDGAFDNLTPQSMPDNVYEAATEMRALIDELTEIIIEEDQTLQMLGEDTKLNMIDNIGSYFKRSYQVFTDKNWYKKVSDDILAESAQDIYNGYIDSGMTPEAALIETKKTIEKYTTDRGKQILEDGIKNPVKQKGKKRLPLKLRMLMGEYGDSVQNFAQTIQTQAAKAASMRAINDVIKKGEEQGVIFKTKEEAAKAHPDGSHSNEFIIGGKKYYSSEGMVYELNETEGSARNPRGYNKAWNAVTRAWHFAVGKIKLGLTVLSPTTQAINFTGNSIIALNNGHFDISKFPATVKAFGKNKREFYNYLIKEGVINSSVSLEMVEDLLNSNDPSKYLSDAANNSNTIPKKVYNAIKGLPKKAYEIGDDFWKIYGFMNEASQYSLAYYKKPYSKLNPEEKAKVDKKAADNIKNIYPNYSQISEFVRKFKGLPAASPFLSFTYESFRVQVKNLKLAYQELADPNPRVKALGLKRLMGIATATAGVGAVVASAQEDEGMDRNTPEGKAKYELAKRYTFPWQENSDIVPLSTENGVYKYIDATASNPFGPSIKMINAYDSEKDLIKNIPNLLKTSLIDNFLAGDILANTILAISNNKSDYGGEIYNPEDDTETILSDIGSYLARKTQPGFVKFIRKAEEMGYKEIGLSMTGMKPYEVDMRKQFGFKAAAYKYGDKKRNIARASDDYIKDEIKKQGYTSIDDYIDKNEDELLKAMLSPDYIDKEGYLSNQLPKNITGSTILGMGVSFQEKYDRQNAKYKKMIHELHLDYKGLVEVGQVSEEEAQQILKKKGFDAKTIQQIVSDAPRNMQSEFTKKLYRKLYSDLVKMKKEGEELDEGQEDFIEFYKGQKYRFPTTYGEKATEERASRMEDAGLDPNDADDREIYNNFVDTEGYLYPDKVDINRFKKENP